MRRTFIALVLAGLLAAAVPLAAAAPPPSTLPGSVLRWVDATFDLAQPDLGTYQVSGTLLIYRYDVGGKVYDADDLGNAYVGTNKYRGEASGAAFVTEIEAAARAGVNDTLSSVFPDAKVSAVTATADRATLVAGSGDPYTPAVKLTIGAKVERTRAAMGLGNYSDEAVTAVFAAGARVTSAFSVSAQPGYHATYAIHPPAGLVFSDAGVGTLSQDGRTATYVVDNLQGTATPRQASLTLRDATARAPEAEDIRSTIEIKLGDLTKGATDMGVATNVTAEVRSINVAQRFPGVLPPAVRLDFVNADAMRALRKAGVLDDAALGKADKALLDGVSANLTAVLGEGVKVSGGLSAADLARATATPYTADPPVRFLAQATGKYAIPGGVTADKLDVVLAIGGEASFDLRLFAANGRTTTYHLVAPPTAEWSPMPGLTLAAANQKAVLTIEPGEPPTRMTLRGKGTPTFEREDAKLGITVDLKDIDIKLSEAAGGDFGDLLIDLTVTGELGVVKVPDALRASLPPSVKLDHVPSDGIRLLLERGLLSQENITALERELLTQVDERLGAALGGSIPVTGGFDAATLDANLVSKPASGDEPIVFKAKASIVKPLAGGPIQPQAAMSLYTTSLPLALPRLQGLDTTYTVILPRGLAVSDLQVQGGDHQVGKAPDGRDQFTVTPTGESADVVATMSVTPTLVVAKFWPILLVAVLLLVLLVGSPIAFVVMRRRKK